MKLSVILPWTPDTDVIERVLSYFWLYERYQTLLPNVEVVWGSDDSEPFNRSRARNRAVSEATGDLLLFADADTVFHPFQIFEATQVIENGASWVIPYGLGRYYNLSENASNRIWKTDPAANVPEPTDPDDWEFKLDSSAGLLVVPRAAYEAVGGYDEHFIGWGYEDDAFRAALDHRVGPHHRISSYCLHLWHPVTEHERFEQRNIVANRNLYARYEAGELP